jgi:hypothetical protein
MKNAICDGLAFCTWAMPSHWSVIQISLMYHQPTLASTYTVPWCVPLWYLIVSQRLRIGVHPHSWMCYRPPYASTSAAPWYGTYICAPPGRHLTSTIRNTEDGWSNTGRRSWPFGSLMVVPTTTSLPRADPQRSTYLRTQSASTSLV